ncbi:response regulator transcription factor [Flavobacterium tegetincola]|uniref:response regulator transcription factor n=1 Tax=Flavobacterium tegetincola TaxID=150172 RepID=UPI0004151B3D|nr:response regulator transcription factor [Flavobacterium tegetincola]
MIPTNQNILVVDDHPINTDAYINLIASNREIQEIYFHKAIDCESASKIINQLEKRTIPLNAALIDISIPPFHKEKLLSGTDIALLIRNSFPDCIIIMLTMHTEPLLLFNVHKQVKPEGFLSKNDIDFETFPEIFKSIVNAENFYSPSINNSIQKLLRQTIKWDEYDTQIILCLEKGILTKNLSQYINLSLSAIEKRKATMKNQILDRKATDNELIEKCKLLKLI